MGQIPDSAVRVNDVVSNSYYHTEQIMLYRIQLVFAKILWVITITVLLCAFSPGRENENTPDCQESKSPSGLHYEICGSGDPIVALHGLGGSLYTWRNLKGSFPNHRLIMIDLKGAGDSDKPHDKHYSVKDQSDLIYQFILEQDLKNLTLMGNSYGGAVSLVVAIRLCKEDPGRFASLILIDSGGYNRDLPSHLKILKTPLVGWLAVHVLSPEAAAKKVLKDSYYIDRKITKEQIAEYARPIRARGGRYALVQTAKQAIPKNIDEITCQYKTISVPTLIIWGLDDEVIPVKIGLMLHEAIPRSRLELINDCGHVPQEEQPEETMRYISAFFSSLGQRP